MAAKKMLAPGYDFGVVTAKITADLTANSTTTMADVTGLGLAVPYAGTFDFEFVYPWQCATTSSSIGTSLSGPANSFVSYTIQTQTNTTTTRSDYKSALAAAALSAGNAGGAATSFVVRISGRIVATAAGTLQPQFAATVASNAITIKAGGYATLTPR
jgi:hypothetical protein